MAGRVEVSFMEAGSMSDMRCMCDGIHDCPIHGMPWPHMPMTDEDKLRDVAGRLGRAAFGERAYLCSLVRRLVLLEDAMAAVKGALRIAPCWCPAAQGDPEHSEEDAALHRRRLGFKDVAARHDALASESIDTLPAPVEGVTVPSFGRGL